MSVNGSVASSSGEVFAFPVGDVFAVPLNIPFGESEVEEEDFVGSFIIPYAKIIGFDISMDEVSVVHVLNAGNHLVDQHENGLEGKLP